MVVYGRQACFIQHNDLGARTRVNDIRMYYAKQHFKLENFNQKQNKQFLYSISNRDINNKI